MATAANRRLAASSVAPIFPILTLPASLRHSVLAVQDSRGISINHLGAAKRSFRNRKAWSRVIDAPGAWRYLETTEEALRGERGHKMVVALTATAAQAVTPPAIRKVSCTIAVRRVVPR